MATQLKNIRISLRRDTSENWNKVSSQVLLPGELAIVSIDDEDQGFKIGNGISSYAELPFFGEEFLTQEDLIPVYQDLLSPDEVKLYKGPGGKDISLSVGTGIQLCIYTATLSDFYLSSETSSAVQIENKFNQLSNTYSLKTIFRDWS